MIDVGATHVGDHEMLAYALANTSTKELQNGSAIKRGGAFVNEYPRTDDEGHRTDGGIKDPNHLAGSFPILWPYAKGVPETC